VRRGLGKLSRLNKLLDIRVDEMLRWLGHPRTQVPSAIGIVLDFMIHLSLLFFCHSHIDQLRAAKSFDPFAKRRDTVYFKVHRGTWCIPVHLFQGLRLGLQPGASQDFQITN